MAQELGVSLGDHAARPCRQAAPPAAGSRGELRRVADAGPMCRPGDRQADVWERRRRRRCFTLRSLPCPATVHSSVLLFISCALQGAPAVAVQAGMAAPAMLLAVRGAKTTTGIVGLPLVRACFSGIKS